MFNDYSTARALVADRQARLHHEAQQHRLGLLARRRGRASSPAAGAASERAPETPGARAPLHLPRHRTAA
jgi:hypothetical protein